jgi:hypothetical protein
MAAAKAAIEAAVFPGMIDVIVGIVAARIVANPLVIVVDVRGFRMVGLIAEGASILLRSGFRCAIFGCAILRGARRSASHGSGTTRGHMTAANITSASAVSATAAALFLRVCATAATLEERGDAKSEEESEQGDEILHVMSS